MKNTINIFFLVSILFISCSGTKETASLSVEERFTQAMKNFEDENYLEAIEDYKIITIQFQGSSYAPESQYYLAQSRYLREEYILAASEYDALVRLMPNSKYVPQARYMRAMCYYNLSPRSQLDQQYTRQAIEDFQTFIEYTPTADSLVKDSENKIQELNTKLAKKIYESGRLYFTMEYYKASIEYFDNLLQKYHDSEYADDALLWKAKALKERKDFSTALQTIQILIEKYPKSELLSEAQELQKEMKE